MDTRLLKLILSGLHPFIPLPSQKGRASEFRLVFELQVGHLACWRTAQTPDGS